MQDTTPYKKTLTSAFFRNQACTPQQRDELIQQRNRELTKLQRETAARRRAIEDRKIAREMGLAMEEFI